ncbi:MULTISPECIES: plasmid mobilization protein [Devosia]|uniref:plasmid mobilization protein n=1 Tax=Devosia TaxID=46913 RepID=UPI000CE97F51|nr:MULTISPECIES: hypothetical protein [Devosia]AVF03599.1 hypothetical protein C4375_07595 [Devosia sp. I507]
MSVSQRRRLSAQINVGLTETEASAIDQAARRTGVSRAAFVRRQTLSAVDIPDTTKPRRHRSIRSADLEAVAVLVAELGRTTGSVVQLSKALRQSGPRRHHDAVETILSDLRIQAQATAHLVERIGAER